MLLLLLVYLRPFCFGGFAGACRHVYISIGMDLWRIVLVLADGVTLPTSQSAI